MTQTHPTIRTFNPGTFQTDQEVIEQFVVREHELATVLEILRGNVDADSCQHTLIVAPRGRGKTMLLARVAAELRTNPELSTHLLPIRFMEESHEIFSSADFWLDVLFYLSRETTTHDPELSRNLRDTHADLTTRWRERELDERARAAVLEVADRLGQRLVLMVENLQGLCANVDEHFGWHLRKTLQSEPQIILLASATSRFEGLDDAQDPFFELFRVICLQPLDTEQCRRLWQAVSGDAVSARRIRALQILTGGDPRLMVIVAEFQRHGSMRRLMEQLAKLIDDHTEYFRGHLEAIGKTERRVYLSVIDLWQPSTTGEISARARMDIRTVSTMLGRLANRGAVFIRRDGRRRLYSAAQPLFSIYYKLRRERDEAVIVQNLLRFMAAFYTHDELRDIFREFMIEPLSPAIRAGIERARAEMSRIAEALSQTASDLLTSGAIHEQSGNNAAAIATYNDVVERFGNSDVPELQIQVAGALISRGVAEERQGYHEAAIASCDAVEARYATSLAPVLQVQVAWALVNKTVILDRLGKHVQAIAICDQVYERYGTSDIPDMQEQVARVLFNKGFAQHQLGKYTLATETYDRVVDRYGESAMPKLQIHVAAALNMKGAVRARLGECEAAITACEAVIERNGASDVPELQEQVARALINKATMQVQLGDQAVAVATYDEVVERLSAIDDPGLHAYVAWALIRKSECQTALGHAEGALRTCDDVERKFGALTHHTEVLGWRLWWARTTALFARGKHTSAMDALRRVYAGFVPDDEAMTFEMTMRVSRLVAHGAAERSILDILSSDQSKSDALAPVILALRKHAGEEVRAPAEMIDVAADILKLIDEGGLQEAADPQRAVRRKKSREILL